MKTFLVVGKVHFEPSAASLALVMAAIDGSGAFPDAEKLLSPARGTAHTPGIEEYAILAVTMKPRRKSPSRKPERAPDRTFAPWWEARARLISAAENRSEAEDAPQQAREAIAQAVCAEVVKTLWDSLTEKDRRWFSPWRRNGVSLPHRDRRLAREAAGALVQLSEIEASYLVGTLYTALLPPKLRAARGAYYTPPVLAERLLDLAAAEGADWSTVTALDPACGGGAFLAPLANRILTDHRIRCLPPHQKLEQLEDRLAGIEIDPFAAWLSRTFLRLLAYPVSREADRALDVPVAEGDALEALLQDSRRFDLVVGNPPYGRIGLDPSQRRFFARSLYGHANLYGVFLDAALRWRRPTGLVAFVTPTSFLGGQYFSKLRDLLIDEAPPLVVDFVEGRRGVFDSVLQETCLTVFGPNPAKTTVLHLLKVNDRAVATTRAGTFPLQTQAGSPWLLPRSPRQALLIRRTSAMPTRLHHLGYKASTGPLVWNRHKKQLRSRQSHKTYPLIWAEAVRANELNFNYRSRAASPFVSIDQGQGHLICTKPCVLIQRTTAKEQSRRLVACAVPAEFLAEWGGIVVENHVNVLRATAPDGISPEVLAALLNSEVVDQIFRCLSGSVAVSATELHALPLPDSKVLSKIEVLLGKRPEADDIQDAVEAIVAQAYGG